MIFTLNCFGVSSTRVSEYSFWVKSREKMTVQYSTCRYVTYSSHDCNYMLRLLRHGLRLLHVYYVIYATIDEPCYTVDRDSSSLFD